LIPILLVENASSEMEDLKQSLSLDGYQVYTSGDATSALDMANKVPPRLVILDERIPGSEGYDLCIQLRNSLRFGSVPIILLTNQDTPQSKSDAFAAGADDQITKPFDPLVVSQRIGSLLERTKQYVHTNPLTGLPGNPDIEYVIRRKIQNMEKFAVAYIDIDYFKSYNDSYGWLAGDNVIRRTSEIILDVIEQNCERDCFVGHLGGDDFIAIIQPESAEELAQTIIAEFDRQIPEVYPPSDRKRGYIIQQDRQGNLYCFPLLSISIAICSNRHQELVHPGQVAQIGLELKDHIKTKLGSNYIIDRRKASS
jgi:diguanylate cyclase (GGDEF)-like protein